MSVVLSPYFVVICYNSPRKLTQGWERRELGDRIVMVTVPNIAVGTEALPSAPGSQWGQREAKFTGQEQATQGSGCRSSLTVGVLPASFPPTTVWPSPQQQRAYASDRCAFTIFPLGQAVDQAGVRAAGSWSSDLCRVLGFSPGANIQSSYGKEQLCWGACSGLHLVVTGSLAAQAVPGTSFPGPS